MIRKYQSEDWPTIARWWVALGKIPTPQMLSETTFVYELDGLPVLCASMLLTNCKILALIENLISCPTLSKEKRHEIVNEMFEFLENFAKVSGVSTIYLLCSIEKLSERYKTLGYQVLNSNLTGFYKLV